MRLHIMILMFVLLSPVAGFGSAMQDAQLKSKGRCGFASAGLSMYVHNKNTGRSIRVTVKASTMLNGHPDEYQIIRDVAAGGNTAVGCTSGDHDNRSIDYRIVGVEYK